MRGESAWRRKCKRCADRCCGNVASLRQERRPVVERCGAPTTAAAAAFRAESASSAEVMQTDAACDREMHSAGLDSTVAAFEKSQSRHAGEWTLPRGPRA